MSLQYGPDVRVNYKSCDWNAPQFINFLKENGSSIGRNLIAPEVSYFNHTISDAILNDNAAASNFFIIGHITLAELKAICCLSAKEKEVWLSFIRGYQQNKVLNTLF